MDFTKIPCKNPYCGVKTPHNHGHRCGEYCSTCGRDPIDSNDDLEEREDY